MNRIELPRDKEFEDSIVRTHRTINFMFLVVTMSSLAMVVGAVWLIYVLLRHFGVI